MEKLQTAEEVLAENLLSVDSTPLKEGHLFVIKQAMIEFAKLHVIEALREAQEQVMYSDDLQGDCIGEFYHMSEVYPLTNIK